ncbi:bifunctional (p)ppGpp synthetase/guanosine-3',5'-bis(diphosphate) 3'-pyrophosphohydrolase [Rickettsia endosymbiont of Halotydeus destructor]|uniref:bifunctional (p)ppGpp synthetase/guanosine-3',5'-bis(diphosphate) 3'-pyrophosphohydrolase n=1 Tax=Rickettsia endosymbiont of Halotydeus destructor TaxID=2996754 RepID=UPI003BAF66B5
MIHETINLFQDTLHKVGVGHEIYARLKDPYSILKKMKRKKTTVEKLSDLIAFRIIVCHKNDCYKALDALNDFYHLGLKNIKDYILFPKENGYQSIHAIVEFLHSGRNAEIQLRSHDMHKVAELGRAAHLTYKQEQDKHLEEVFNRNNYKIFQAANEIRRYFSWTEEEIIAYEQEIMRIWHSKSDEISSWEACPKKVIV